MAELEDDPRIDQNNQTVIVIVEIKEEMIKDFIDTIKIDADGSIKEEGCVRFDVLRDQTQKNKFYFYESYVSPDAAKLHKTLDHYQKWKEFKGRGGVLSQEVIKANAIFMSNKL